MILVGYTEFRSNLKKYLQLSRSEKVVIRSGGIAYEVSPSKDVRVNPSPSNDPWFDVPENMEHLDKAIEASHAPDAKFFTWDELKKDLSL